MISDQIEASTDLVSIRESGSQEFVGHFLSFAIFAFVVRGISGDKGAWHKRLYNDSSGCMLRGGPKISRKIMASRRPDFDRKSATMLSRSFVVSSATVGGSTKGDNARANSVWVGPS